MPRLPTKLRFIPILDFHSIGHDARLMSIDKHNSPGMLDHSICFDQDLIERYGGRGPRYTSYPTALQFDEVFTEADYARHATGSNEEGRPLSLYVHIPFCKSLCYYCACNKIITRNAERVQSYLGHLYQEITMQSELFDRTRLVKQLHFGGGTPTYLDSGQMCSLFAHLPSLPQIRTIVCRI